MRSLLTAAVLGLFLACGGTEEPPPAKGNGILSVDQTALELTSLSGPVQVTANPNGLEGTVQWSLVGPGTLSSSSGATTTYSPPAEVAEPVTATLTATLATQQVDLSIHLWLSHFYVNPVSGADANVGSRAHPFQTVSRGLKAASQGMAVILEDGVYPWAGEDLSLFIPVGVTLQGETADGALLDGTDHPSSGIAFKGDGKVANLHFKGFENSALSAETGTLTLQHLVVESGAGVQLGGDVKATLKDFDLTLTGATRGLWIYGTAQLSATDGAVHGEEVNFAPVWVHQTGALTAENVDIDSPDLTLQLQDQASATLTGGRLTRSAAQGTQPLVLVDTDSQLSLSGTTVTDVGTPTLVSHGALTLTGAQVSSGGTALVLEAGQLTATDTTFDAGTTTAAALSLAPGTTSTLDRVHLTSAHSGIRAFGTLNLVDSDLSVPAYALTVRANTKVSGSTVEGGSVGIYSTGALKLRDTTVRGTGTSGFGLFLTGTADLGTEADPGGNTFTATNTLLDHSDPELATLANPLDVSAVGNTWKANVQGADADGHYPRRHDVSGVTSGGNFQLVKAEDVVHL